MNLTWTELTIRVDSFKRAGYLGNVECLELMIKAGAAVNKCDSNHYTQLIDTAGAGHA